MNILYIAGKSNDAELLAFALRSVAPGVVVAWAASTEQARRWIDQYRQVAALIVQVEPGGPDYASFINEIRARGLEPPVIVVAGGSAPAAPAALQAQAQTTLAKTPYLFSDLPSVVKRVLETPRPEAARDVPATAAPAPGAIPANPFAQLGHTGGALEERLHQALAVAARADAALAEAEHRLAEAKRALERAETRHAAEMQDATARLAEERAHANERSSQASAALEALRAQLVSQATALQGAEQQAATDRQAAAEEAARRQGKAETDLLRETANREALEQKIANAEAAHAAAAERQASELAGLTERLDEVERHSARQLAEAARNREALMAELADADRKLQQEAERHAVELADAAAAARRAEQQLAADLQAAVESAAAQKEAFGTELAQLTAAQQKAEGQLANANAKLRLAEERHTAEIAGAAARLEETRQEHETALAAARAELADTTAALKRAAEHASIDRQAAIDAAAAQRASFDAELAQSIAKQEAIARQLTGAQADLQQASELHAAELASAASRLTAAQHEAEAALAAAQQEAEVQLANTNARLRLAEERHAAEIAGTAARLEETRQEHETALAALRAQLADTTDALQRAGEQASIDRQAAIEAADGQKAAFEAERAQHAAELAAAATRLTAAQQQAEAQLADGNAKLRQTEERHTSELAAAAARLAETQQEAQAAIDAAAAQKAAFDAERAQATAKHEAVTQQLVDAEATRERAEKHAEAELAHAAAQTAEQASRFEARLAEEASRREAIERELAQAREESERAQQQFLSGVTEIRERSHEHARQLEERAAAERAEWETTLADRQTKIGNLQRDVDVARQSLAAREDEIKRVQAAQEMQRVNFNRARAAADAELTKLREESAALQEKLDDYIRRFDAAPASVCRCGPDGTIRQASRTLARLLGYATAADLQQLDLGASVFTSRDELPWLIDRCRSSRTAQSIETTWAKKDGSRILVRLVATAAPDGGIDLAADDVTAVKALEERLNHAQRLESVARLASEVAVTCENLLTGVKDGVEGWLSKTDNDALRYEGQRLVADMNRASGFLRQLTLFGDKQKQATPLVAANTVLRDLASVLKRVAGDNITFVLPKDSKPLNLDVEAEQVERIFVNVAAFARQRMPFGGRLLIEVVPALLDREFVEKYPSVRPGAHVLFTVTEQRSPNPSTLDLSGPTAPQTQDGPGLDLGVMQSLVADCGGHLWMAAEPSGDMVLKIHLPRRALDDSESAKSKGGWISRLAGARR